MTRLATAEAAVTADEFADSLESQIQRRLGGRVRDLRVLLREDGVILQGRSATYHAKQLAQHAAMELAGVRVLANDIEVC
jgi:osmotically-inducible protein OsmY